MAIEIDRGLSEVLNGYIESQRFSRGERMIIRIVRGLSWVADWL